MMKMSLLFPFSRRLGFIPKGGLDNFDGVIDV